jgi:S1-C subfamily serine protease
MSISTSTAFTGALAIVDGAHFASRVGRSAPVLALLACVSPGQIEPRPVSELFEQVNPAVVEIYTRATDVPNSPSGMQVSMSGVGSGVLISPDGKILTAAHVVETASAINVRFLDGETMKATAICGEELVVGGDIVLVAAGIPLAAANSLTLIRERITSLAPGESLTLIVLRGGTTVTLSMPLPALTEH